MRTKQQQPKATGTATHEASGDEHRRETSTERGERHAGARHNQRKDESTVSPAAQMPRESGHAVCMVLQPAKCGKAKERLVRLQSEKWKHKRSQRTAIDKAAVH